MNYNKGEKMQCLIVSFKLMGLVFVSCLPEKKGGTGTDANEAMFTLEDFNLAEINNFFPALFSQPRKKSRIHSDSWP
jgi:hypothetical protein